MWCTRSWAPSSFLPQDLTFKFVPGVPPQDLSQCFTNDWDPLPKRRAPAGPEVRRGLSILLLWECYLMQQLFGGPCKVGTALETMVAKNPNGWIRKSLSSGAGKFPPPAHLWEITSESIEIHSVLTSSMNSAEPLVIVVFQSWWLVYTAPKGCFAAGKVKISWQEIQILAPVFPSRFKAPHADVCPLAPQWTVAAHGRWKPEQNEEQVIGL